MDDDFAAFFGVDLDAVRGRGESRARKATRAHVSYTAAAWTEQHFVDAPGAVTELGLAP